MYRVFRWHLCGAITTLLLFYCGATSASTNDAHSRWFDVASMEWISHKPSGGSARQVKLMRTYVLVKMENGSVKKVWEAKITLLDGRVVIVHKGRLVNSKSGKEVKPKPTKKNIKEKGKESSADAVSTSHQVVEKLQVK